MDQQTLLNGFMKASAGDARLGPLHISIYAALLYHWGVRDHEHPMYFYRHELVALCKISGTQAFHRTIRDLHAYGYIRYVPSYNHFLGSLVYFYWSG